MIKTYYLLTKPGIILGNAITTLAGFALASKGNIDWMLFLATFIGLSSVIASAGVFNNAIDRDIDKKMERTKNRPLVKGLISIRSAMIFATVLLLFGVFVLAGYTNMLTVSIVLAGFFVYVVLYSFWKTKSSFATIVGSVSGASPPVVGYCAVSNHFDGAALILFVMLLLWQMPHFFAIAMYRFEDYAAALIPILPIKKGMFRTKIHIVLYILAFIGTAALLTVQGYTGYACLMVAVLFGMTWLVLSLKGFKITNDKLWARQMFIFSLVTITALSFIISVDVVT